MNERESVKKGGIKWERCMRGRGQGINVSITGTGSNLPNFRVESERDGGK